MVLYSASGCHLCERARSTVLEVQAELRFPFEEVDITGDPALETTYREFLPVVEIDGRRAFAYHVPAGALRRELGAQSPSDSSIL